MCEYVKSNNIIFLIRYKSSFVNLLPIYKYRGFMHETVIKQEKSAWQYLQKTEMWTNHCCTFCCQQHNFWVRSPQQWAHLHTASNWHQPFLWDHSSCPHIANHWWRTTDKAVFKTEWSIIFVQQSGAKKHFKVSKKIETLKCFIFSFCLLKVLENYWCN